MREALLCDHSEFFAGVEADYWDPCLMEGLCPVAWSGAEVADVATGGGGPLVDSVLISSGGSPDIS